MVYFITQFVAGVLSVAVINEISVFKIDFSDYNKYLVQHCYIIKCFLCAFCPGENGCIMYMQMYNAKKGGLRVNSLPVLACRCQSAS